MVKLVIHCSDIHIRNKIRFEEYAEQLTKFRNKCEEITKPYKPEEVRILISGDIMHNKNTISPELYSFTSTFIRDLQTIAQVLVIAGNHDLVVNNTNRKDAITGLFDTAGFENTLFLDNFLGYQSGTVIDDNITWALYSIYDDFKRPDIENARKENPDNLVVGLYHGTIVGASLNNGTVIEDGTSGDIFEGCDCVMAGDIHKRQDFKRGDVKIVYPGSLIQQTFGETVTQHGFVVWDVETCSFKYVDLESDYGMYDFEIKNVDDIDEDKEVLINY